MIHLIQNENQAGKAKSTRNWIWRNWSLFEQIVNFKKKTRHYFNKKKGWI